jgi:hypothetical protein
MSIDQQDDDEQIDSLPTPAPPDRFGDALALCRIANNKTVATALKKLRRVNRQIADAEAKVIAVSDQAEQMQAALAEREAQAAEREAEIERRESSFEVSLAEARDHLRAYYDSIAEADRHIRYRIMSHADLLGGYNPQLQDLPTWDQLKRLVVGLPDDPPPIERDVAAPLRIDAFADVCSDPSADRHGAPFLGELTRDVSHKRKSAA